MYGNHEQETPAEQQNEGEVKRGNPLAALAVFTARQIDSRGLTRGFTRKDWLQKIEGTDFSLGEALDYAEQERLLGDAGNPHRAAKQTPEYKADAEAEREKDATE